MISSISTRHAPSQSFLAIILDPSFAENIQDKGWVVETEIAPDETWIMLQNVYAAPREQGWKLHISAGLPTAEIVLRRVLPVLLVETAEFKIIASLEKLAALNTGEYGISQIGKFITIYPNDDVQAVRLASALHAATAGLEGPTIPSDRPLLPGSLVHYRFGSFRERVMQTVAGSIVSILVTPDGDLIPDERPLLYRPPNWAVDPFLKAGVAAELKPPIVLIKNRYLFVSLLARSARGSVFRGVDITTRKTCIIKWAQRGALMQPGGRDARDRLRHEIEILRHLQDDARFPHIVSIEEQDNDLFLIVEDLQGQTLAEYIGDMASQGCFVTGEQVVAWGRDLASMLKALHERGLIYRDVKSRNVLVTPDGCLRVIDFDLVYDLNSQSPYSSAGTRGYMSPQQNIGECPAISDDVYGLGALLYFLATGAEPAIAPSEVSLLERPIRLLNPTISPFVDNIITHCLDPIPERRPSGMRSLIDKLGSVDHAMFLPPPLGDEGLYLNDELRYQYGLMARRLGDTLCHEAQLALGGQGYFWQTTDHARRDYPSIYNGNAGVVLVLAELVSIFQIPEHRDVLRQAALLLSTRSPTRMSAPGLYMGAAGLAAALLRVGQILNDSSLIEDAIEQAQAIAALPYLSPDLMAGAAGRLRFHLLLWDATHDQKQLHHAIQAGEYLLGWAKDAGKGALYWPMPKDRDGKAVNAIGFAHGAAGIGDALLDLFDVTGDERFLRVAQGATCWITNLRLPALNDGSGLTWPKIEGEGPTTTNWANGAAGIGRFLIHAAQCHALPEVFDLAARAARTVARGTRWQSPTLAHGLSGNIDCLLDMFQFTKDLAYLNEAASLAHILQAFLVEEDGILRCLSTPPKISSASYMTGYGGVTLTLLRLSDPERRPHHLSRLGFQYTRDE